MELATWNLQNLSGQQFYTLCANKNCVPVIGWPQIPSEWRHVRAILMQNKGLQESLSWAQILCFNQLLCMKWRRIDSPTEPPSRMFNILTKKNYLTYLIKKVKRFLVCRKKKRSVCYRYRTQQEESVLKSSVWYVKKWLAYNLYDISFFCLPGMGKCL